MSILEKTKQVLGAAESELLGFPQNKNLIKPFLRLFIYPIFYLKLGFKDLTRPFAVSSAISFLLIVLFVLVANSANIPQDITMIVFNVSTWGVLLLVSFSTPSSYAFYGVKESDLTNVVNILTKNGINTSKEIELFEKNLDRISERIDERVKFYRWLIGLFWALYLLFNNFHFRLIGLTKREMHENDMSNFFSSVFNVMLFTGVALLVMACYKRASKVLLSYLYYACVEKKSMSDES